MSDQETIFLYTDGAASGNPGPGGYGAILIQGNRKKILSGGYRRTTNNRMEMMAVIAGLSVIKGEGKDIVVVTDSKYVHDAVVEKWLDKWIRTNFKGKKNADLWILLHRQMKPHHVRFQWVRGHNGHPLNEECDRLAVAAAAGKNLFVDEGYEAEQKSGELFT